MKAKRCRAISHAAILSSLKQVESGVRGQHRNLTARRCQLRAIGSAPKALAHLRRRVVVSLPERLRLTDPASRFNGPSTSAETNRAIEFIQGQEHEEPWCMFLSWHPPHAPLVSPEAYLKKYKGRDLKFHPNVTVMDAEMRNRYQRQYAHYYGLVAWLDTQWSRLMKALEESGQADNTIVVFTSDHGEMLNSQGYRGKRWPHRESTQVPFLIRWPGAIEANTILETPFGTPDIFPTLCGLAGIDIPMGLDGTDLSSRILGNDSNAPQQEYAYMTMHHGFVAWPGWRGIRTAKYNYARLEDGPWVCFDLENDPYEQNNLAETDNPIVSELDGLVLDAMKKTGDSWRDIDRERGEWQSWLGYKQVRQLESHAEYPGSEAIQNWAVRNKLSFRDSK